MCNSLIFTKNVFLSRKFVLFRLKINHVVQKRNIQMWFRELALPSRPPRKILFSMFTRIRMTIRSNYTYSKPLGEKS